MTIASNPEAQSQQQEIARMTPPRPKINDRMKLNAAIPIAREIFPDGSEEEIEEYASQIARYGRRLIDGYELASVLERRYHWSPDASMVEQLDGFSVALETELRNADRKWALTYGIKPPLPDGTRVRLKNGALGTIDGVAEYPGAAFVIRLDGKDDGSRRIVNFEDVSPENPEAAGTAPGQQPPDAAEAPQ